MDFFYIGRLLKEINVTSVTLIPKLDCPKGVGYYRLIACCGFLYEAITKILANRLNRILPDIISFNQGAFVTGRSTLQNILVC
ncbi:LINE-1 retrotransposable element ORF2 protein [Bienertia sinuspersici]